MREKIFEHIRINAKDKGIILDSINGYKDHVHCLLLLNKKHSISKDAQLITGESSNWINKNNLLNQKFSWQDDYWAVSISERHVTAIRGYIRNQEEHHKKKMFNEELDDFLKNYESQDIKTGE